jgi:hypothetical protein
MTFRKDTVVAVTGWAILAALPAFADLTIKSTVHVGDNQSTTVEYMTANKIRTSNGDHDAVMDFQSGSMIMIDNKKKEYTQTSAAELAAQMQAMQAQLQKMGPMANMFGAMGEVSVKKEEGSKKIAGYDCDHYVVSMGDNAQMDMWMAASLPVPTQYYDAAKAMYAALGPMGQAFQKMTEALRGKGFPLSNTTSLKILGKAVVTTKEATEVSTSAVPASAFDPPAGYKQVPLHGMK